MNNFYQWLTVSSADPNRVALTIKGAIVFIPTFLMLTQVFGLHSFDQATLTELINEIAMIGSLLVTLFGISRKIYYTFKSL